MGDAADLLRAALTAPGQHHEADLAAMKAALAELKRRDEGTVEWGVRYEFKTVDHPQLCQSSDPVSTWLSHVKRDLESMGEYNSYNLVVSPWGEHPLVWGYDSSVNEVFVDVGFMIAANPEDDDDLFVVSEEDGNYFRMTRYRIFLDNEIVCKGNGWHAVAAPSPDSEAHSKEASRG